MDGAWERAVEAARGGEDPELVRSLTLDGALKCSRLPSAYILQQFPQLRVLSIANVGLTSLASFPYLPFLERLVLSDNRISGDLEHLVEAGLRSLRDLDLSNNKIHFVQDLAPLAHLNLVSLDLYECPITRLLPEYRSRVFNMIKSLQYLDKLDPQDNDRPESDDEEEDEDDVEDELGEEAEVDENGEENAGKFGRRVVKSSGGRVINFMGTEDEDYVDEDDEKEDEGEASDEVDEEDGDATVYQEGGKPNDLNRHIVPSGSDEEGVDYDDDAENVEIQDVDESEEEVGDDDEDGVEGEDEDDEEDDVADRTSGRPLRMQDEIDGQEVEDDGEDENGELVADEEEDADEGVDSDEEDDEDEEDYGTEYLVQPVGQANDEEAASDFEPGEDEDDDEDIEDDDEAEDQEPAPSFKRKRGKDEDESDEDDGRPPKH